MRAVLTYHSVDKSGSPVSIDGTVFDQHARWLTGGSVRVRPLEELVAEVAPTSDNRIDEVAITFDDGFANTELPIRRLLDSGLPVTVFVVTGHVGGTNAWSGRRDTGVPMMPLLGWDALAFLSQRGATMGAHTRTHPRLTALAPVDVSAEMDGCRADILSRLGIEAHSFAYPYGAVNAGVMANAAARFATAVSTRFATVAPADSREAIPRLDMYYYRRSGAIRALETAGVAYRLRWIRLRRHMREALA